VPPTSLRQGWCFAESCWATLTKSSELSLDIGQWTGRFDFATGAIVEATRGTRKPPLTPETFARHINGRTFTNGKVDRPLVIELYTVRFRATFLNVRSLCFKELGWDDKDVQELASVLAYDGGLKRLAELDLSRNRINDVGATVLARTLPKLPAISMLNLNNNYIGRRGMSAIAVAMEHFHATRPLIGQGVQMRLHGNRADAPKPPFQADVYKRIFAEVKQRNGMNESRLR